MSFQNEQQLREEIVLVGKLMYEKGLIEAMAGNISARLDKAHVLITPSGLSKGMMTPDQMIIIDMEGRKVTIGTSANQNLKPTSETPMHLEAYQQRPDVLAVVHAHPPHAIALSIAGISLAEYMIPETIVHLGLPPTTPYSNPGSEENALAIREVIKEHDALILERHGSLSVGDTPLHAYYRTEMLEQAARFTYLFKLLGGGKPLPSAQVEKLIQARGRMGLLRPTEAAEFRSKGITLTQNDALA